MNESNAYYDGIGDSGLAELRRLQKELGGPEHTDYMVFRVPLAAHAESHRRLIYRGAVCPSWEGLKEEHGPGRYEVVLLGPPPRLELTGVRSGVRRSLEWLFPFMKGTDQLVARGRVTGSTWELSFGNFQPPKPKPIATKEQPSLFNPTDCRIPAHNARDTSYLAAEAIAPFVNELQAMVLKVVLAKAERGATCDEVEVETGRPHQTISARINELIQEDEESGRPQLLFDIGIRRSTRHNQLAIAWVHRDVLYG